MTNKEIANEARELFDKLKKFLEENEEELEELSIKNIEELQITKIKDKTEFRGFYLSPAIAQVLDQIKDKRKGINSDIVNIALKEYLEKDGKKMKK